VSRARALAMVGAIAAFAIVSTTARLLPAAASDATSPMTDEDVVRMVNESASTEAILQAIRTRPPGFDLSEDMTAEMRQAGVGDELLAAMHARAAEAAPPPKKEEARLPRGTVAITVRFAGTRTVKTPSWADEDVKGRLGLSKELDARTVKDLAIYLACTTPEHVPDVWRGKTPLGRDLRATPRHEMLAFVAGDTAVGQPPRLTLPQTIEATVDDVEPHKLVIGIAARIGDRWYTLSMSKPLTVKPKAPIPRLIGRIRKGATSFAFDLELEADKTSP
jgi:hypothetical protein